MTNKYRANVNGKALSMRNEISIVLLLMAVALSVCTRISRRSNRSMGTSVGMLLGALIFPVVGNLIIIASRVRALSTVGSYIYFVGMDLVMFALLRFTLEYCRLSWPGRWIRTVVHCLLIADAAQLLLNPLFGHAFSIEMVLVSGEPYYRLMPHAGQALHRLVDYGIFFAVLVVFFVEMVRAPRLYFERYAVIFFSMAVVGVWETFYIFSRSPIDQSMVGFGAFGLMVFYFALYYRPVRLLDRMLANIASELPQALFFFDAADRCVWANRPGRQLAALENGDYEPGVDRLRAMFEGISLDVDDWNEERVLGADEAARYYALEKHAVTDRKGRKVGSFLSVRDDTEQKRAMMREAYSATHDSLTGLYTREYLYIRVRQTIRNDPDTVYNVCYLDVDDFKMINDVFGHAFGDYALRCIADSMRNNLPKGCLYGRLGGDIFGMCIPDALFDLKRSEALVSGIEVKRDNIVHQMVLHQGVYRVTERDLDVSVMFDRAHMAQETIKGDYKKHVAVYDDAMRERVLWEQRISAELQDALAQRQICVYLQAMVDISGAVVGAEALVRWNHPTQGLLTPGAFVPVFEKNGMIADMDKYMWRSACEILARWQREGHDDLFISINVSPKDFYFMDVEAELKDIVAEYGISPSRLRVEITETVMMTDNENRIEILNALRAAGFLVEMDDFGSGYSSLNMLKDMPVDIVKIDMVFLKKARDEARAQTILQNIMKLTGDLQIASLTEGVETEKQYEMLSHMGCKMFQGYYFARPMTVERFEQRYVWNREGRSTDLEDRT